MYTKCLLVIGAGFLQSFIIKKSKELGYYTIAIDGDENAVGFKYTDEYKVIDITNKEKALAYAKEKCVDGVLTGATDYGVITTSYIAQELNLKGLNLNSATLIKDKFLTRKVLFDNKIDSMNQYHLVESSKDINDLKNKVKFPVIVKPVDGSGSKGVSKVCDFKNLIKASKDAINNSLNEKALIESFIVGNEFGVESVVYDNKVYILSILEKKMTKEPNYAELMHIIPSGLKIEEKIKAVVTNAIKSLNVNFGSVNMDILIDDSDNVYIVDVGARMGGNMISSFIVQSSIGYDYIGEQIKYLLNDNYETPNISVVKPVVSRLITLDPGTIEKIPSIENIEKKYNVKIYFNKFQGDKINEYKTNLDGAGYILSYNKDRESSINDVELALIELNSSIVRRENV